MYCNAICFAQRFDHKNKHLNIISLRHIYSDNWYVYAFYESSLQYCYKKSNWFTLQAIQMESFYNKHLHRIFLLTLCLSVKLKCFPPQVWAPYSRCIFIFHFSSLKNENSVIIYSPSCHSKPEWFYFCCKSQIYGLYNESQWGPRQPFKRCCHNEQFYLFN